MALSHIDPYPWFLNKSLDLVVNEQLVRTRITASEWTDSWRPLLGRLYDMWIAQFPKRYLIAVAGPPGAGKSVFAEQLHFMIDKGILHKEAHTIALPMDGFHFPNAYLETHTRHLPDGSEIPLSSVKGQPDTIDIPLLRKHIQTLIERPEYVMWPAYSRYVHDVVPDKFKVHASINMVIVEGNYLMVNRGPFAGLPEMFDLRIYVDAPAPKIIANLVDRHIQGGKSLDEAKAWVKRIDLPNARLAESSRHHADVIIERDTDDDIASITWKGEAPILTTKAAALEAEKPTPPPVSSKSLGSSGVHAAMPGGSNPGASGAHRVLPEQGTARPLTPPAPPQSSK